MISALIKGPPEGVYEKIISASIARMYNVRVYGDSVLAAADAQRRVSRR